MPKRSRYNTRASEARKQRIDQQQAILQRLREGGALSGAQPATPFERRHLIPGRAIPDLYAEQKQDVPGGEILVSKELYSPETAELGLAKLAEAIKQKPKQWVVTDWPDLTEMEIFK